jgi:cell division protein FtsI/penicillin-binding protein 2
MLWRGRLTLLGTALAVGLVVLLGWMGLPDGGRGAAGPAEGGAAEAASVSSAPPGPTAPTGALLPPVGRDALEHVDPSTGRLVALRPPPSDAGTLAGPLEVRTTLDAEVTRGVWKVLDRGRVALGHVLVLDPESRELRAYVSTDPERFSPTRTYPAASLVKVVTAAAALDVAPEVARGTPCRYVGSPWRLTRARVDPPRGGRAVSLRRALATSNNQCFAQLAVHRIGGDALLDAIDRFGLLRAPGPGHAGGHADDPGADALGLGRLGSGLAGLEITPLHALGLAATLVDGRRAPARWVDEVVDAKGRPLVLPPPAAPVRVMTHALADRIREMMVDTTVRGTARKAFRARRGRPLLQGISVAGKTGSLNGEDPSGRYEWFIGLAPADQPRVVVATVAVQGPLYWMSASQMAAEVLKGLFCPKGVCRVDALRGIQAATPTMASARAPEGPGTAHN